MIKKLNLFTAVYASKLQRFHFCIETFPLDWTKWNHHLRNSRDGYVRERISKICSQLHVGNSVALPFKSKNAKFHRPLHAEIMVNADSWKRTTAAYAVRKNAISVKGNLLSAQLRTHRNSCKSRIDIGQLSREWESSGVCYTECSQMYDNIMQSCEAEKTKK